MGHIHKIPNVIGIVSIAISFVLVVVFNGLAGSGAVPSLFKSNVGNLSNKYELDITPAGWTFSIWSVIYIWMAAAIIFYISTIFSTSEVGRLYLNPEIVSLWYSFFFILNLLSNIVWIFVWDREYLIISAVFLFIIADTNIIALGMLARNVSKYNHQLRLEKPKVYWSYVGLALNGLAVYTTWTCIASLLNFGHVLHYVVDISMEDTVNICLSLLLVLMVGYFVLEVTILDRFVRFIVTPFIVVIWALCGILVKKANDPLVTDHTKMYLKGLLGLAGGFLVLRTLAFIVRECRKPLGKSGVSPISENA